MFLALNLHSSVFQYNCTHLLFACKFGQINGMIETIVSISIIFVLHSLFKLLHEVTTEQKFVKGCGQKITEYTDKN